MSNNGKLTAGSESESLEHLSYEEAYTQLQALLETLENGDLSLEESLQAYELGTRLVAYCTEKLEQADLRVRRWQDANGTVQFEGWNGGE